MLRKIFFLFYKTLARLIKKKKEKTKIIKFRNEGRDTTTTSTKIKRIIRECHKQLCTNKLDSLYEKKNI